MKEKIKPVCCIAPRLFHSLLLRLQSKYLSRTFKRDGIHTCIYIVEGKGIHARRAAARINLFLIARWKSARLHGGWRPTKALYTPQGTSTLYSLFHSFTHTLALILLSYVSWYTYIYCIYRVPHIFDTIYNRICKYNEN